MRRTNKLQFESIRTGNAPWARRAFSFAGEERLRDEPSVLCSDDVTDEQSRAKSWGREARELKRQVFPRGLFAVSLCGLSERGTTPSLQQREHLRNDLR